jgi:hypothetical protein
VTSPRARIAKLERQIHDLAARQVEAQQASEMDRFAAYHGREFDFCAETFLDASGKAKRYWAAQRAIFDAVKLHRRVSVRSCRKGSKTESLADLIVAFAQTGPAIIVSTAAGGRQVETGLWSRVRAQFARTRVPLLGECLTTRLNVAPDWYAIGFSTRDSGRFLGFHAGVDVPDDPDAEPDDAVRPEVVAEQIERAAHETARRSSTKRLLLLFDEAPHVDPQIYEASRGSMLGDRTYVVLAGNPHLEYEEDHEFARSHHPRSGYWRIKITAPEGPDEEPDPIDADETFTVPSWLGKAEDYERLYPKGTPLFGPDARGRFRDGDVSGRVITFAMLRAAAEPSDECVKRGPQIGVDTAGDGADKNVMALYVDSVKVSRDAWHSQDTLATWERIQRVRDHWQAQIGREIPWRNLHIDAAPIAKGIVDLARRQGRDLDCVDFGGKATHAWRALTGDVSYKNRRAELHWVTRELLRTRRACVPARYTESWRDLTAASYDYNLKGELVIEAKEAIKARLGHSPDDGDADMLALAAKSPTVAVARVG